MKKSPFFLIVVATLLISSCSSKKLDKTEASQMLASDYGYPGVWSIDINRYDEDRMRQLRDGPLEKEGYIEITKHMTLGEWGSKPWITLTEKSKPYILPAGPKTDTTDVPLRVVSFDIGIRDITYYEQAGQHMAKVEYELKFHDKTPFSILINRDFSKPQQESAIFKMVADKWERAKGY